MDGLLLSLIYCVCLPPSGTADTYEPVSEPTYQYTFEAADKLREGCPLRHCQPGDFERTAFRRSFVRELLRAVSEL